MSGEKYKEWDNYRRWILDRVGFSKRERFYSLLTKLHDMPFEWYVFRDKNRAEDGIYLRTLYGDPSVGDERECSVLEMLAALSIRMCNEYLGDINENILSDTFEDFLKNLGLLRYSDASFNPDKVATIVGRWILREFDYSGAGSIFPLQYPDRDQRDVEIWDQMVQYINEKYHF